MTGTTKSFESIHDDYAFFERHATEADVDLWAYRESVENLGITKLERPRLLDFGCGSGSFSEPFVSRCGFKPGQASLSLIEVDPTYRTIAAQRLAPWSDQPIRTAAALVELAATADERLQFDLVLANHVFYYVVDLDSNLRAIKEALTPHGALLASMAGRDNALIEVWLRAFARLGRPVPYHTSETFADALWRTGLAFETKRVNYELVFPDTSENRRKILRFLLTSYLSELPDDEALSYFDEFAYDGKIEIDAGHQHFVARRPHEG